MDAAGQAADLAAVQRMADGDASGLAELYERHARGVYSLALRILENQEAAEDVVQDVFAQAWRQAARYVTTETSAESVAAWLLRTAHGRATDRVRARGERPADVPLDASVPQSDPPPALAARVMAMTGEISAREATSAAAPALAPMSGWLPLAAVALVIAGLLVYVVQLRGRLDMLEGQLTDATTRLARNEADVREARTRAVRGQAENAVLTAPDLIRVDLTGQQGAPEAAGRVFWSRAHGLVLAATRLPDVPRGRSYQVWVLTAAEPVTVGLVTPDAEGRVTVVIDTPVSLPQPTGVAVSLEASEGAAAPTGDIVLLGNL